MHATRLTGFTLVELLVSIAVIGILAALALSAVASAKVQSQAAQCVSNLRQLAAANLAHAADRDGEYVIAQEKSNNVRWHGVRGATSEPFDPTKGPLAPYLGREGRVKLCPVFKEALKGGDSFENSTGGYGYNATYIGGTPRDIFRAATLAQIARHAGTVMFTDTAFARAKGIQEYPYSEPFQWVNANGKLSGALVPSVHFRHGGRANVAWCDGHVTAETASVLGKGNSYGGDSSKWKIGWFGPSAENGFWNPGRNYHLTPEN